MTKMMLRNILGLFTLGLLMAANMQAQDVNTLGPAKTEVKYSADTKIFPCKWRKKKTNAITTQLGEHEIPRVNDILTDALAKYPENPLDNNLKEIHVLRTMSFYGLEYGGTYYKKKVYITNNGIDNGYTDQYIEGTFHHEFSSILLKRHRNHFDKKAWLASNPADFDYGDGGLAALKTQYTSLELDPALFSKGFLNQYSMASFEEDFNCYAEFLFISDDGFWQAWEESEAVRRKTSIIIGFYNRLDPVFNLEYFRGF